MICITICILAFASATLAEPQRFKIMVGDDRIVKGSNAPHGKYPSQVSLQQIGTWHQCGGTILNENWVLTSAFCIQYEEPRLWWVYAGDVDLEGNGEIHEIARFILHEDYDNGFNMYDLNNVGLVEVVTPFTFGNNIQPVILPRQNLETPGGSPATIVGWGSAENDGTQFLQEIETFTVDDINCSLRCDGDITYPSTLCAEVPPVGTAGLRFGDDGGPLFANGMQVGIMSWAPSAQQCSVATCFYADVCKYVDWINSKIN